MRALLNLIASFLLSFSIKIFLKDTRERNAQALLGRCQFYGPNSFLELGLSSMIQLKRLDPIVYNYIIDRPFVFWSQPKEIGRVWHDAIRVYTITEADLSWGQEGIITTIVGAYFSEISSIRIFGIPSGTVDNNSWNALTKAWLQSRGFPDQLVNIYS
jgi:hypothetical protein